MVRIGVQEIYEPGEVDTAALEREIEELKEALEALSEEEEVKRAEVEAEIKRKEKLLRKAR